MNTQTTFVDIQSDLLTDVTGGFSWSSLGKAILHGSATGAVKGAATGAVTGAIAGAPEAGVGAIPGAAAGAVTGSLGGLVSGGVIGGFQNLRHQLPWL